MLDKSNKRTTFAATTREDLPFLEFNQVFKPVHIVSLFKPHEMQWSIEEYMKQGHAVCEEQDRRILKLLSERTAEVQKQSELYFKKEGSEEPTTALEQTTRRIQQLTK